MGNCLFYLAGSSPATEYARTILTAYGIPFTNSPYHNVTHLLLDVPSFQSGSEFLFPLLEQLPVSVTVIGGNLSSSALIGYKCIDLLKQENYLCRNAAITAHCALAVAFQQLKSTIQESPALILGWGRIGKCLAASLKALGCEVWLCIRNPKEIAMANALGYHAILPHQDVPHPESIRLLFNTVPQLLLSKDRTAKYQNSIKIDLASSAGMEGDGIIIARGLPGKYAPESSGRLISRCILDIFKED